MPVNPWKEYFAQAPQTLAKMQKINTVVTAFNANVDSVVKMSGAQLAALIERYNLTLPQLQTPNPKHIDRPQDIVRGIFRCFSLGIAEEWIAENEEMYHWMQKNLGTEKLQIGAQAGIIANTLSITGIKQIIVHTAALPKMQAEQFLPNDNLLSFDQKGNLKPVHQIDRVEDTASIHWIVEFNEGDSLTVGGQVFTCPKANRFIATYDPLLFNLVIDDNFTRYTTAHRTDYIILSGYQALTEARQGIKLIKKTVPILQAWRQCSPKAIIHLEIASTQDTVIRKNIIRQIGKLVDSVGVNERETIDLLEALNQKKLASACNADPSAVNLFKAIVKLKEKIGCRRIQLHMFGLYITVQEQNFPISAQANRRGMVLAATAAASKADLGHLNNPQDITESLKYPVSDIGLRQLKELAGYLKQDSVYKTGLGRYRNYDIIAVPTILIKHPKTLVGMGDTISSFSLVGAT